MPAARTDPGAVARSGFRLEETVLPSPHSTDLARTPLGDYVQRFDTQTRHIAELFQENTKLTPYSSLMSPANEDALKDAREFYFSTAYRMDDSALEPGMSDRMRLTHADLPPALGRLLGPFSEAGRLAPLLYGLDVFLMHERRLLRVIPETDQLWIEIRPKATDEEAVRSSILRQDPERLARARCFVFILAAPWRYMMFLGPRGYRHVMFEAGDLMAQLEGLAAGLGLQPLVCRDFFDARVDRVLQLDGAERTTLGIIALEGQGL